MPKSDEQFLARFLPGSPEEQYYATLQKVVRSISFPMSEAAGFALLRLLDVNWMVIGELNTLTNPVAGSAKGDAELVSHVFATLSDDPCYWHNRYLVTTEFDNDLIRMWIEGFSRHGKVEGPLRA